MTKTQLLEHAIEITKEYTRAGGTAIANIMDEAYEKLKELNEDVKAG